VSLRTLTQEDPIGLAGGLNLYGFAGGDPINFWDPFGLSADSIKGDAKHEAQRVINVFRNSDENDAVNGTQKKIMGAIVDEYDRVASSDTEHLNAVFGVCPKNADAPGCYDHPSRTMTINPDAIEANQSLIWRSQSTVAAHELGHWADWQLWNHSGKEPFANSVEAIFRSVLNLPAKTFRPWR